MPRGSPSSSFSFSPSFSSRFPWMLLFVLLAHITRLRCETRTCPKLEFFSVVNTECIEYPNVEYDARYLKVTVTNVKDYKVTTENDSSVNTIPLTARIEVNPSQIPKEVAIVQDPYSYRRNQMVGVAVDGIPIYSSLSIDGVDSVSSGGLGRIDRCGGMWGPTADGTRYHYRVMPTCVETGLKRWNNSVFIPALDTDEKVRRRRVFIHDTHELMEFFDDTYSDGPDILGYSLSGYPIYSPLNENGALHENLDNCNGKYVDGKYGYYAKPTFPYIIGCEGPGLFSKAEIPVTAEALPTISEVMWQSCPAGYFPSAIYEGGCQPCPAGTYSPTTTKFFPGGELDSASLCSLICPVGFFCPEATIKPLKCPAGRYGSSTSMTSEKCTGPCSEGHFCPAASTSPTAQVCGRPNHFCPVGSAFPRLVDESFYTLPESPDLHRRSSQELCEPPNYCINGIRAKCPAGTFGNSSGLIHPNCTDSCLKGHYCPEGSVNPTKCPAGSYGATRGLKDSSCSGLCSRGHWCPEGSISATEVQCAAGKYGPALGAMTKQCKAPDDISCEQFSGGPNGTSSAGTRFCPDDNYCSAGYYCPAGSYKPDQNKCGGPHLYCPPSTALPKTVELGYYSIGPSSRPGAYQSSADELIRTSFALCEAGYWCRDGVKTACSVGRYGKVRGEMDPACSGLCQAGFKCGSASTIPTESICGEGPHVYCPEGSHNNIIAPSGFYTVNGSATTKSAILPCEPGNYCIDGIKRLCPSGRYSKNGSPSAACDGLCDAGFYCPEGSASRQQAPCPGGTWGTVGQVRDSCSGLCLRGYYCPTNSTSPTQFECGSEYHYCPYGSFAPVAVEAGHYSTGGTINTRFDQTRCNSMLNGTVGDYCYVRDETVCYSKYGYDILSSLQTGFWDSTGSWIGNFFSNVTWEITQEGRYCYRRDLAMDSIGRHRTNTAIYGSHCTSEQEILNGDPPKARKTVHICPDTTVQYNHTTWIQNY